MEVWLPWNFDKHVHQRSGNPSGLTYCTQERTETAPTILEEVAEFSKYELERPFRRMLSDGKVMKQLKAWGAKKRKTVEDDGQAEVRQLE